MKSSDYNLNTSQQPWEDNLTVSSRAFFLRKRPATDLIVGACGGACLLSRGSEAASRQAHNLEIVGSNPAPAIYGLDNAGGKQSSRLGSSCRSHGGMVSFLMDALLGDVWPRMARTARYERNSRLAAFLTFTASALRMTLSPSPPSGQTPFFALFGN